MRKILLIACLFFVGCDNLHTDKETIIRGNVAKIGVNFWGSSYADIKPDCKIAFDECGIVRVYYQLKDKDGSFSLSYYNLISALSEDKKINVKYSTGIENSYSNLFSLQPLY